MTEDQRDALQEVANIGMGRAGAALAEVLGTLITLSIPRVQVIRAAQLEQTINTLVLADSQEISAVRQSFRCDAEGEAIVIFNAAGCDQLADLMGYDQDHGSCAQAGSRELLFDVANILIGACLGSVFEQLGRRLSFSAPSLIAQNVAVEKLWAAGPLPWDIALLLEVNFSLQDREFNCHLLTLMPETSLTIVQRALDTFLHAL